MNDDTISRKATIDAVHTATYAFICGMDDGDEMTDADKLVLSINKAVCAAIKALPSAQPQQELITWLLDEIWDDESWTLNCDAFPEILCRKLVKLGYVAEEGGKYVRIDKPESGD